MSGTMVLGIGNPLGGDDAVGSCVVQMLNRVLSTRSSGRHSAGASVLAGITVIDGGTAPESYTSVIRRQRPESLILIDAADMGLPVGAVRIIPEGSLRTLTFSTHHMPLSAFISYVKELCGRVWLIGIQPAQTEAGTAISKVARTSARKLVRTILEGRLERIPLLE